MSNSIPSNESDVSRDAAQPEELPAPIEQSLQPTGHSMLQRAVAIVALGSAVGGLSVAAREYMNSRDRNSGSISQGLSDGGQEEPKALPKAAQYGPSALPGELGAVDNDFRAALSKDTCATRVTPAETLRTYQELYGPDREPKSDPVDFKAQVTDTLKELQTAKQNLTFAVFPTDEFRKLERDALRESPQLPLSEYWQAVDAYLAQLGIKTLHDWQPGAAGAPDPTRIKPVDNDAQHTGKMARRSVLATMSGFSQIAKELVTEAGYDRVIFGDIRGNTALGMVVYGNRDIYVDTAIFTDDKSDGLDANLGIMEVVPAHEGTHLLQNSLCWKLLGNYTGDDDALADLNRGMPYTDGKTGLKNGYVSLGSNQPGKVTVARNYGGNNAAEDMATVGELAFYGLNADDIYKKGTNPNQDIHPVREKLALLLTRVEKKNPALAKFYVALARAGRMEAYANAKYMEILGTRQGVKRQQPGTKGSGQTNPEDRNYLELTERMSKYNAEYFRLRTELDITH